MSAQINRIRLRVRSYDIDRWREDWHPAWRQFLAWTKTHNLTRTRPIWERFKREFSAILL